jgi:hypothetical protein
LQAEVGTLKRLQAETAVELARCSVPSSTKRSKEGYEYRTIIN